MLKEKLGVKEVVVDIENACVEHNSVGLVMHCGSLEEFIFSDGILYIDNDLDNCYYKRTYSSGEYTNLISEEKYIISKDEFLKMYEHKEYAKYNLDLALVIPT